MLSEGVPEKVIAEVERRIERAIEHWAGRLLIIDRDQAGRLTVRRVADALLGLSEDKTWRSDESRR